MNSKHALTNHIIFSLFQTVTKFRPRTRTGLGLTRRNPRAPRAAPRQSAPPAPANDEEEDDEKLYANVPRRGVTVKVTNPQYVQKE